MRLIDKHNESVSAFVRPSLEAGERQLAVLGQSTRASLIPSFMPISVLLQTPYGVVVTDRRVFLVRLAKKIVGFYPPNSIEAEYPKTSVSAPDFKGGIVSGELRLQRPGAEPLKLNVQRAFWAEARAVTEALHA
jgi:hypothetical protein